MFPTDDLIEKLDRVKENLISTEPAVSLEVINKLRNNIIDITDALIDYYEWRKKPFMENMSKPGEGAK